MTAGHFEAMAAQYAAARPPYPAVLWDALEAAGVVGPGLQVLEIGAGAGLATAELVRRGSAVTAVEPGAELSALLRDLVPAADVVTSTLEDADLPEAAFDSAVAATSMHWVDLGVGLPLLHRVLRPGGWLAVWRHVFGDESVTTPFRARVDEIVARRPDAEAGRARDLRPTTAELVAGGLFEHVRDERWRWSLDLTAEQIGRLFRTFSNWTTAEAQEAEDAAAALAGSRGTVTEHYQVRLQLLRRAG